MSRIRRKSFEYKKAIMVMLLLTWQKMATSFRS